MGHGSSARGCEETSKSRARGYNLPVRSLLALDNGRDRDSRGEIRRWENESLESLWGLNLASVESEIQTCDIAHTKWWRKGTSGSQWPRLMLTKTMKTQEIPKTWDASKSERVRYFLTRLSAGRCYRLSVFDNEGVCISSAIIIIIPVQSCKHIK